MLNNMQIKQAKPKEKAYKLADSKGLYLYISPNGFKSWRYDYSFNGKRKTFTIGEYPIITLLKAREIHLELLTKINNNIDPAEEKKAQLREEQAKIDNQFKNIALEWYNKNLKDWTEKHRKTIIQRLERNIFPYLGTRNINSITTKELSEVLRKIEDRGALEVARRVRGICEQIYTYAISLELTEKNIAFNLRGTLQKPQEKHFASITDPQELGELLRRIDANMSNGIIVKTALQIMPYVFVRANELCRAEWQEIDFDKCLWTIPAERMKMRIKHIVPLARQVITLLKELHFYTGQGKYLFHSGGEQAAP